MVVTITLPAGKSWTLPAHSQSCDAKLHRNVYFHSGSALTLNGKAVQHAKIKVKPDVDIVLAAGLSGPAEVLILQGREIPEPTVQHGPFVGNTQQDIMQAFADYQRTGFGGWPWESDAMAFPRDRARFAKHADGTLVEKPLPEGAGAQ